MILAAQITAVKGEGALGHWEYWEEGKYVSPAAGQNVGAQCGVHLELIAYFLDGDGRTG